MFVSQFSHVSHFVAKTKDFMAKTKDFVAKMKDFVAKTKDFLFFFIFAKNPSSLPQCLSMCRHTNEGIPSTEHVQMLHWACADIIMRGNPVTDMTDNTETQHTDSVYTLSGNGTACSLFYRWQAFVCFQFFGFCWILYNYFNM